MFVSLILLGIPTSAKHHSLLGPAGSSVMLIILGISAGLFTVPLQAYLQARTPREHKGRVIGAMNLLNWIGIASAGGVYIVVNLLLMWHAIMWQVFWKMEQEDKVYEAILTVNSWAKTCSG